MISTLPYLVHLLEILISWNLNVEFNIVWFLGAHSLCLKSWFEWKRNHVNWQKDLEKKNYCHACTLNFPLIIDFIKDNIRRKLTFQVNLERKTKLLLSSSFFFFFLLLHDTLVDESHAKAEYLSLYAGKTLYGSTSLLWNRSLFDCM